VYAAYGIRLKQMDNVGNFSFGPSLGVLYGGPYGNNGKLNFSTTPAGTLQAQSHDTTVRALVEGRQKIPINSDWAFGFGGGVGLAFDIATTDCTAGGALNGACSSFPRSINLGFATWEIGPSIMYHDTNLAVRYVGFTRGGFLPWNTIGLSLGYDFDF